MAEANSSLVENQTSSLNSSCQHEDWLKTFNEMRLNEDETDVVLVCGESRFPAHKLILMASSPVFKTMFQSSFKESTLKTVEMNFEPSVMKRILNFIYMRYAAATTFEDVDDVEVAKTLEAAHYLQIENLHCACCHQLVKMASASDFSLIYSLNKYDKLMAEFIAKHGLALLKDEVHLKFNSNHFQLLLKELKGVVTSQDLIRETLTWLKHDDSNRSQCALDLFALIDLSQLSRTCINSFIEDEIIQNDEKVLCMFLKQYYVAPELPKSVSKTEESESSLLLTEDESVLIKSLKLIQFIKKENSLLCVHTSFNNDSSMSRTQVLSSPVELVEPTPLTVFKKEAYLVCGRNDQNESKMCVKYSPKSNTAKFMWKLDSQNPQKEKMDVQQIVRLYEGDALSETVYVMFKPDSEGKSSVYFKRGFERSSQNHVISTGKSSLWLTAYHSNHDHCQSSTPSCIYISRHSCMNTLTRYCLTEKHINNKFQYFFDPKSTCCFHTQHEFKLDTTVCSATCVYSFVGDDVYIYNIVDNSCSSRKSGITVNDKDVVYPVRDYTKSFYVVVRQDHSETEYSYSLLDINKQSVVTEIVAKKGALCETVILV